MLRRPLALAATLTLVVGLTGWPPQGWAAAAFRAGQAAATAQAPAATASAPLLSNQEFWRLATEFSEPDGTFHSENLVSNEIRFQQMLPELVTKVPTGRAYVGVGSEQNFTYMVAVRPTMAFIVDIRRGNLDLHLLYKALFELSADRAEFVSRLFSLPQPAGLTRASTAQQIFDAYARVLPSEALYKANLAAIYAHLTKTRGIALGAGDRGGIEYVYSMWFSYGPQLRYFLNGGGGGGRGGGGGGLPTYAELMTTTDGAGRARSYLATEANFAFIKDMHARNQIVPVVGNFGGPQALRAVAAYLKQRRMTVGAFYASNVEQYLERDGLWENFCASVATMPMDAQTTLIRSTRGGFSGVRGGGGGSGFSLQLLPLSAEVKSCAHRPDAAGS